MNQLKIIFFLLNFFIFIKPLTAMDSDCIFEDDCYTDDFENSDNDDEATKNNLECVFMDYAQLRENFQSCWGAVQSIYGKKAIQSVHNFFNNKSKIKYTINENGIKRQENRFLKEIPENDIDFIESILENKIVFYNWIRNKINESNYNSNDLNSNFLSKKMPNSFKKHFYINGLVKYYTYNHNLFDLLCKKINDAFTSNVDFTYHDLRGDVKLFDAPETNFSQIRIILRQIEQDLKDDINLQHCLKDKKHSIKHCSTSCVHHYFKDVNNIDLYKYYNLSLGRFNLLEKVFGSKIITELTETIQFYMPKEQEIIHQTDLDTLVADFKKFDKETKKSIQHQKSSKGNTKKKKKIKAPEIKKEGTTKTPNFLPTKTKLKGQSDFQAILPNGQLLDCPQQTETKEKKKKGIFNKLKKKTEDTIDVVQQVAHAIQHPQEEMNALRQRINELLNYQSSIQQRLEHETQKVKEAESAKLEIEAQKIEIEEKYAQIKEQLHDFETQKKEQERILSNLEKESADAITYAKKLETLSTNSIQEADGLRAYTNAMSAQTHAVLQHNYQFAFLLNQYQQAYVLQNQLLQQVEQDRLALIAENERLKEELAKKENN